MSGSAKAQVGLFIHSAPMPEEKRQFGFRWLGEQAAARKAREEQTFSYVRWTFFAAVAAVFMGVVGVIVTLFH